MARRKKFLKKGNIGLGGDGLGLSQISNIVIGTLLILSRGNRLLI